MKINKLWNWLFNPPLDGPSGIILLRLMAGGVFLWEGMLKFIYVNQRSGPIYQTRIALSTSDGKHGRRA